MNKTLASLSLAVLATSLIGSVLPAEAKQWNHGVNNRQQRQQNRIQQGVHNGSLNGREAQRLRYQQKALNRQEARYRASGNGLSPAERNRLEREQNQLSQNIYHQKHDGQDRIPGNGPGNGPGYPNYGNPNRPGNQLYDINQTQHNQQNRIYNGVQNGELTQREAARLDNQQDRLEDREAQMRKNGLTFGERVKLDNMQDRMSREIYQQKHDSQDRN
jgi:hypothetical protein